MISSYSAARSTSLGDFFTIEDQVSAQVVSALQLQIATAERARLTRVPTQNADAYSGYLQGRRSSRITATRAFARRWITSIARSRSIATTGSPMRASPWPLARQRAVCLRAAGGRLGTASGGDTARALKPDPNLAEAHLSFASAAGTLSRNFDSPTVIRGAQVALTLDPNLDLAPARGPRLLPRRTTRVERGRSKLAEEISGGTDLEVSGVRLPRQLLSGRFDDAHQMAETLVRRNDVPVIRHYRDCRRSISATGGELRTSSPMCGARMAAPTRAHRRHWQECSPPAASATTPRRGSRVLAYRYIDPTSRTRLAPPSRNWDGRLAPVSGCARPPTRDSSVFNGSSVTHCSTGFAEPGISHVPHRAARRLRSRTRTLRRGPPDFPESNDYVTA